MELMFLVVSGTRKAAKALWLVAGGRSFSHSEVGHFCRGGQRGCGSSVLLATQMVASVGSNHC